MKLVIISGSQNKGSASLRVSSWLKQQTLKQGFFEDVFLLDLGKHPLPFWSSETMESGCQNGGPSLSELKMHLREAEAFVVVTPEWSGMATPAIKNFFIYAGAPDLMAHKPALAVGVSAGQGGAYPIAELRMSGYKNAKILYIPDHWIVRHVEDFEKDEALCERGVWSLNLLSHYAKAMAEMRGRVGEGLHKYDYGM